MVPFPSWLGLALERSCELPPPASHVGVYAGFEAHQEAYRFFYYQRSTLQSLLSPAKIGRDVVWSVELTIGSHFEWHEESQSRKQCLRTRPFERSCNVYLTRLPGTLEGVVGEEHELQWYSFYLYPTAMSCYSLGNNTWEEYTRQKPYKCVPWTQKAPRS